ncbi:aldose 1-epimerase [Roseibium hamelinense]|uniref:Aldose 1-epimerase n=1 Tax=Roseibium hamelinense TaxID=150831 RepID=A0A562SHI9_9HYPH|nr:aldose epimerase family protein [Roseibium hamelinense]MTI43928.1 galactose mutarotase [Roseibium hamelinense]TWI80777.1 aldose 1-epimerase [Roseibium hamelinense]
MIRTFGHLPNGREVQEITLKKGALEADVLTYGGIIRDLRFDGQSVVLGYSELEPYLTEPGYVGAIIGRCANRISEGRCLVDCQTVQLDINESGTTHLHGGMTGFSKRTWAIEQHDKASVLFKLVSEDGDQGYPGRLETLLRYTLTGSGALRVKITATTDKATPVNLTQHSYFNLNQSPSVLRHRLEVAADSYLPVDARKIPTGEVRKVAWTPFDFQENRVIATGGRAGELLDHTFCLSSQKRSEPVFAAALESPDEDTRMEVWTTEPGLHIYDAAGLSGTSPGLAGEAYGPHAGLCLETQGWPDAPNHANFPNVLLQSGETYHHITEFRFS